MTVKGILYIYKGQPWQALNLRFEGPGLVGVRKGRGKKFLPPALEKNIVARIPAEAKAVKNRVIVRVKGREIRLWRG